ncbi:hypothetical protein V5O48_012967 [Marasmius crinis-equi]|uniref:Uncharacterized protein n=1 Tax=Marasmius crinis-equi TaxID=585013 RepID=A0ABR3F1C9_9AGAR
MIAIIVESGFMYSAALLVAYTIATVYVALPAPFDPTVITAQFAGLAPTLLIVRVAYNKSYDSVNPNQMVSTLAFASAPSGPQESRVDRLELHSAHIPGEKSVY